MTQNAHGRVWLPRRYRVQNYEFEVDLIIRSIWFGNKVTPLLYQFIMYTYKVSVLLEVGIEANENLWEYWMDAWYMSR